LCLVMEFLVFTLVQLGQDFLYLLH
jgi:hypothetical protein